MGNFLDDNITSQIKEVFNNLTNPVEILVFTRQKDCDYCEDTRTLLEEVCSLSDKVSLKSVDVEKQPDLAGDYHISRTPGIVVLGQVDGKMNDFGIRFSGIPAGHEFSALIHSILTVSSQDVAFNPETMEFLNSLKSPIYLEVFTTPT
jgi:alkyl hydroperoxide reductase subunit AhpF